MYNLDVFMLILFFGAFILGGGMYWMIKKQKPIKTHHTPVAVPEDKFETAEELFPHLEFSPEPEYEPVPEIPWGYDDNKISVMARDPQTIFAYWDISEKLWNSLRDAHGSRWENSLPVLRIYDVTGIDYFNGLNANKHYDIVINDYAGNWYLHVGTPDRTFCVDLGRILNDGKFITVARSNFTSTPRNSLSDRIDPEWMLVSENQRKLYSRVGKGNGMSSLELFDNFVQ